MKDAWEFNNNPCIKFILQLNKFNKFKFFPEYHSFYKLKMTQCLNFRHYASLDACITIKKK